MTADLDRQRLRAARRAELAAIAPEIAPHLDDALALCMRAGTVPTSASIHATHPAPRVSGRAETWVERVVTVLAAASGLGYVALVAVVLAQWLTVPADVERPPGGSGPGVVLAWVLLVASVLAVPGHLWWLDHTPRRRGNALRLSGTDHDRPASALAAGCADLSHPWTQRGSRARVTSCACLARRAGAPVPLDHEARRALGLRP